MSATNGRTSTMRLRADCGTASTTLHGHVVRVTTVDGVGVEMSARRSAALPCRPVCADCSYSRSSSVTFCGVWRSHGTLDQHIDRQLRCLWPQNLEPTTASPPTARTVAIFVQAPAQDPPLQALVCWLWLCLVYTAIRRSCDCCELAPIINIPDQLNSVNSTQRS